MKYRIFPLLTAAMLLHAACSDDTPAPMPVEVTLTTEVYTRAQVNTSLDEATQLTVLATLNDSKQSVTPTMQNMQFTRQGTQWTAASGLTLMPSQSLSLQACYPAVTATDPSAVPVSSAMQDVLYSGSPVTLTYDNPSAHLTMKHALSLFSFNVASTADATAGTLKSLSVLNVPSQGTLNLSTGQVNVERKGDFTLTVGKTLNREGWSNDLPGFFVLPGDMSSIKFTVQTDEGKFECSVPTMAIEGGNQYIFHLVVSSVGVTLLADQTQVVSLNKKDDAINVSGQSLLRITHKGAYYFTLPTFTSDTNLTGNINWGDGQAETLVQGTEHEYSSNTTPYTVIIETWNAQSVTIPSLNNVQSIDFSDF